MPSEQEIREALRAGRVVPLHVPNPHGPLGLEQLAAAVDRICEGGDTLSIRLRRETREKLEQLARTRGAAAHPVTAAEVAAAIVEEFVSATPLP